MPGIRGTEPIEVRPSEARMEEMIELDRKVDPFLHTPVPASGVATSFYQAPRTEGMKEFLQIGEKGSLLIPREPRANSRLRNELPREMLGFNFWVESIREFFRPALDLLSHETAGFAAPLMIFSFILKKGQISQMPYAEFQEARETLEKNAGAPQTERFLSLVTFQKGPPSFHDSWVTRGWVEVGEVGEEVKRQVAVTTSAYQMKPTDGTDLLKVGPASGPELIEGYRLYAGSDEFSGGILIQTKDRQLVETIHDAFVNVYSATGSQLAAFDWLLYKSQWAKSGLFEWDR